MYPPPRRYNEHRRDDDRDSRRDDNDDFLFSLLALPLGAAVKLPGRILPCSAVSATSTPAASVETLDAAYVAPGASKDVLLAPSPAISAGASSLLGLKLPDPTMFFFGCSYECPGNYLTDATGVKCPDCDCVMRSKCRYVTPPAQERKFFKAKTKWCDAGMVTDASGMPCPCKYKCGEKLAEPCQYVPPSQAVAPAPAGAGFVHGVVTYTVTDSLAVAPMSSSVALLSTFAALDLGAVQEKTVQLGHTEGLEILRASLQSRTVLTDVFLGKEQPCNAG